MSITVLYALLALVGLAIIFGAAYKLKGVKTAFIASGIALVIYAILFVVMVYAIISAMAP